MLMHRATTLPSSSTPLLRASRYPTATYIKLRTATMGTRASPSATAARATASSAAAAAADEAALAAGAAPAQQQQQHQQPWLITSDHLDPCSAPQRRQIHLIVLNWHLPALIARLWPRAATRLCADGGANRLYDEIPRLAALAAGGDDAGGAAAATAAADAAAEAATRAAHVPDAVIGDLDSARADVRSYYAERGATLVDLSFDQDTTDLTKCLRHLDALLLAKRGGAGGENGGDSEHKGDSNVGGDDAWPRTEAQARWLRSRHVVIVLGALGGRLDHTLAHLNALYEFPHLDISLVGDGNHVRLLPAGACVVAPHPKFEGPVCGLVPLAAPAVATSRGLKWELRDTEVCVWGWGGGGVFVVICAAVALTNLPYKQVFVTPAQHKHSTIAPPFTPDALPRPHRHVQRDRGARNCGDVQRGPAVDHAV
jgi:thiamine pyrophosphokinase